MTEKNLAPHRTDAKHSRGAVTAVGKGRRAHLRHSFYLEASPEVLVPWVKTRPIMPGWPWPSRHSRKQKCGTVVAAVVRHGLEARATMNCSSRGAGKESWPGNRLKNYFSTNEAGMLLKIKGRESQFWGCSDDVYDKKSVNSICHDLHENKQVISKIGSKFDSI
jgi:hypothetical protein